MVKEKKNKMILEVGSEANLFYFDPLSLQGACFAQLRTLI